MRDEKQYLYDIVDATETIISHVADISFDRFLDNKMLQQSVLFSFTIIGEAANKISIETKEAYPEIDWSSVIGFRNTIVHAYFSLNLETVWTAATKHVLPLGGHVRSIIRHQFGDDEDNSSN